MWTTANDSQNYSYVYWKACEAHSDPPPLLPPPSRSTLGDKFLQGFKTGDLNDLYLPLLTHCFSFLVNVKHCGVLPALCWLEIHFCWISLLWLGVWVAFYHLLIGKWISINFKEAAWLCWCPVCMIMVFDHPYRGKNMYMWKDIGHDLNVTLYVCTDAVMACQDTFHHHSGAVAVSVAQ